MNDFLLFVVAFLLGAITVWLLEEGLPPSRYPSRHQPRYDYNQLRYKSTDKQQTSDPCELCRNLRRSYVQRARRRAAIRPCNWPCDH